jgi:hypothetical protein
LPSKSSICAFESPANTWDEALADIPSANLDRPGFCGIWSAKEVVAHLGSYEQEMVNILRQRAFVSSELWQLTADGRNAAIHAQLPSASAEDGLSQEARTFRTLMALLTALDEGSSNDPGAFPPMPADWKPWQVFASNTYEHYDSHLAQAKAALHRHQD